MARQGHRAWFWVGICALVVVVLAGAALEILISRAAPILKARLLQGISERFHSRVELGDFDVSLLRGFEVSGKNLSIYPYNVASTTPTFSARHFAFRTGYSSLFRSPLHIGHVEVEFKPRPQILIAAAVGLAADIAFLRQFSQHLF